MDGRENDVAGRDHDDQEVFGRDADADVETGRWAMMRVGSKERRTEMTARQHARVEAVVAA